MANEKQKEMELTVLDYAICLCSLMQSVMWVFLDPEKYMSIASPSNECNRSLG